MSPQNTAEEEETVSELLCRGVRYSKSRWRILAGGRKLELSQLQQTRTKLFLRGYRSWSIKPFRLFDVSETGRRMQCASFPVTGSGIWDSTSPNVPGIKSPQTNRDNIAELWSRDWYQRSKSLSPRDESSEQFIPTFSPPFKYQVQLQQQQHKRLRHSRCCKDRENTTSRNGIHRWYKAGRVLQIPQRTKK